MKRTTQLVDCPFVAECGSVSRLTAWKSALKKPFSYSAQFSQCDHIINQTPLCPPVVSARQSGSDCLSVSHNLNFDLLFHINNSAVIVTFHHFFFFFSFLSSALTHSSIETTLAHNNRCFLLFAELYYTTSIHTHLQTLSLLLSNNFSTSLPSLDNPPCRSIVHFFFCYVR